MTATARRQALVAVLAGWLVWCTASFAQQAPPPVDQAAVEAGDSASDTDDDDGDGDGEYDPANDIFAPSETIRADSEISFPSDI